MLLAPARFRAAISGVACAVAMTIVTPGYADDRPPRYDVDGLCNRLAATLDGFSVELQQQCVQRRNDAVDAIRRVWRTVPDYIQRECDQRARAHGDQDYLILQSCIHDLIRQSLPDTASQLR